MYSGFVGAAMINTIPTIVPIFVIILLGWLARVFGFIRAEFIEPANRLVFYLAIPAAVKNIFVCCQKFIFRCRINIQFKI